MSTTLYPELVVCLCDVRFERWPHSDGSRLRIPTEWCYQPAVAEPGSSHIKVKMNSPDRLSACPKMMDCTPFCSAHRPSASLPPLLLFHLSSCSLSSSACPDKAAFFLHSSWPGSMKATFVDWWKDKRKLWNLFLSIVPSFYSLPSSRCSLGVMFNQRDRDRTFDRDKVNGKVRAMTKLLTPWPQNMNKRCATFFRQALYISEHFEEQTCSVCIHFPVILSKYVTVHYEPSATAASARRCLLILRDHQYIYSNDDKPYGLHEWMNECGVSGSVFWGRPKVLTYVSFAGALRCDL